MFGHMKPRQCPPDHDFLTIPQTARRFGISSKRLRRAVKSGELPAYSCGTSWPRIYWPEYLEWVRSTRVQPSIKTPSTQTKPLGPA